MPSQDLGQTMNDLSRGYVPIVIVCAMIVTAIATGSWMKGNEVQVNEVRSSISAMDQKFKELSLQVTQLSAQVSQLTITLASGPKLPENVAYKGDFLRFCLENRNLKCPTF